MPDAGTPAQTPVPPAAPAPEPRHFALDLLQRQDFAQRRDARNFLEQYLWLGCRMGGMAGFVGVCVGVSVRASRARAGAGCVCACGRCACVCVCARVGAWRVSVCARVGAWRVSVCASAGPKCVCVSVCACLCVVVVLILSDVPSRAGLVWDAQPRPKVGYVRITWCTPLQQGGLIRSDCMADGAGWAGFVKALKAVGTVRELSDEEKSKDTEAGKG